MGIKMEKFTEMINALDSWLLAFFQRNGKARMTADAEIHHLFVIIFYRKSNI